MADPMTDSEKIVARDFANVTGAKDVFADFDPDDEVWMIEADGKTWVMEIGSDDDDFTFTCDGEIVHVPFSEEYLQSIGDFGRDGY